VISLKINMKQIYTLQRFQLSGANVIPARGRY